MALICLIIMQITLVLKVVAPNPFLFVHLACLTLIQQQSSIPAIFQYGEHTQFLIFQYKLNFAKSAILQYACQGAHTNEIIQTYRHLFGLRLVLCVNSSHNALK